MNTAVMDEVPTNNTLEKPGAQLERIREQKGFTQEYVAGRLHLRVKVIDLLEKDDYARMPEPVFIKGYLRAYAKLLNVVPEPFLEAFNEHYNFEKKPEKTLWQGKKESNKSEKLVRLITVLLALSILAIGGGWWYKNSDHDNFFGTKAPAVESVAAAEQPKAPAESEIRLTDLSKMQSMFSTTNDDDDVGSKRG